MPDLFARPLGPDGEPAGPMRRLGTGSNIEVRVDPGACDQWEQVEKIVTRPNPYLPGLRPARFTSEYTFTIKPGDEARVMSLFHGGPTWLWTAWLDGRGPAPVSRGTAWADGAGAACVHQLTGPPEPVTHRYGLASSLPPLPRWYIAWVIEQMRRAHTEHPDLFNPTAWLTGDLPTDLTASQLAEQRPDALRLYNRNWNIATEPGAALHAPPRTVARDYPPPDEPCADCVAATTPFSTWVQQWWRRFAELLADSHANRPPRTDFMPHYPK